MVDLKCIRHSSWLLLPMIGFYNRNYFIFAAAKESCWHMEIVATVVDCCQNLQIPVTHIHGIMYNSTTNCNLFKKASPIAMTETKRGPATGQPAFCCRSSSRRSTYSWRRRNGHAKMFSHSLWRLGNANYCWPLLASTPDLEPLFLWIRFLCLFCVACLKPWIYPF